jgi:hypothetical protein
VDARLVGGGTRVLSLEALEAPAVEGVARVAHQLADKDLAVRVERVGDEVQDLADVRLKTMRLHDILRCGEAKAERARAPRPQGPPNRWRRGVGAAPGIVKIIRALETLVGSPISPTDLSH